MGALNGLDVLVARELKREAKRFRPLDFWQASSEPQDFMIRQFVAGNEVYAPAGNRSGKTEGIAAAVVGILQGRESIAGYRGRPIVLPRREPPVIGAWGGLTYKLMGLSSMVTIRRLLGDRSGFTEEHAQGRDNVTIFHIRHARSRDENDWSRLAIFPYDGPEPEGPALDLWVCDEPPPMSFITALRSRKREGRKLLGAIPATPRKKAAWKPISEQFPPKERMREVIAGRVRVSWPVTANEALSEEDLREITQRAMGDPENGVARDPFWRATLYGDEVDMTGQCPWPEEVLTRWLARCYEPETEQIEIQGAAMLGGGRAVPSVTFTLQRWAEWDPQDFYWIPGDPGKGIRNEKNDPDGLQVWSVKRNALVARVNDRLGGFMLGRAMAKVGKMYGNAMLEPFVTGGYGDGVLAGITTEGYPQARIARDRRVDRLDADASQLYGYTETANSHNEMVAAIERAMLTDSCGVWSREVVEMLMECVRDEKGNVVAEVGGHARFRRPEDFVLMGRSQVVIGRIRGGEPLIEVPRLNFSEAVNRSMGRIVDDYVDVPAPVMEDW